MFRKFRKITESFIALLTAVFLSLTAFAVQDPEAAYETAPQSDGQYSEYDAANGGDWFRPLGGVHKPEGEYITAEEAARIEDTLRSDYGEVDELPPDGENTVAPKKKGSFYSLTDAYTFSTNYFYNQMNTAEKSVYNQLKNACDSFMNSSVTLTEKAFCDGITFNTNVISSDRYDQLLIAFYYSNPQYYFLSTGYGYSSSGKMLTVYPYTISSFRSYDTRSACEDVMSRLTMSWLSDISRLSGDFEKERYIYEKICEKITYKDGTYDQTLAGALWKGECVCNGYAMAMTYFCNAAGVDCISVVSVSHAWNIVKIDGTWYHVDTTWMDTSWGLAFDVCNKSHDSIRMVDGSGDAHVFETDSYREFFSLPICTTDYIFPISSIDIKTLPKTEYYTGDSLDLTGAALKVNRYDNTSETVTMTADMLSGYDLTKTGTQKVTVSYNGFTTWFDITVSERIVTSPAVTATPGNNSITLSWEAVPDASKYAINRYNPTTGKFKLISSAFNGTELTIDGLVNGTEYTYLVQAYVDGKWSIYTEDDFVSATPAGSNAPVVTATPGNNSITLSWEAVPGATKYAVCRYKSGKYTSVFPKITGTSCTIDGLVNGTEYTYLVQAYVGGKWSSYTEDDLVTAAPDGSNAPVVTATPGNNSITLSWEAIPGAVRYAVCRYKNGRFTSVFPKITGTSCTIDGLVNGAEYTYLVQAYVGGKWSSYTEDDLVTAAPEGSNAPVVTATPGNNSITLSWEAVPGATKYAINRYNPATGKFKLISSAFKGTEFMIEGLTNGVEYTYLVQAYVGGWSSFTENDFVSAVPAENDHC